MIGDVRNSVLPIPTRLDEPWNGAVYDTPISTDIETTERQLVEHLQNYAKIVGGPLRSVAIEHFPDNPRKYRLTHQVGAVVVIFNGTDDGVQLGTNEIAQDATYFWDFGIKMRVLGWSLGGQSTGLDPGAYQMIRGLTSALLGLQLRGFTPMTRHGVKLVARDEEEDGGAWIYQATFAHKTPIVGFVQPEPFPPLVEIDFSADGQPPFDLVVV